MKKLQTIFTVAVMVALLLQAGVTKAQNKREFRGVWIQCVNGQYLGKTTEQIQNMLSSQLDELQKDGVNAVIFQVRAECDALYESKLEPWSRYLTGKQGMAPSPYWDPLQWMVEQCRRRGMELHAWINLIVPSMEELLWGSWLPAVWWYNIQSSVSRMIIWCCSTPVCRRLPTIPVVWQPIS